MTATITMKRRSFSVLFLCSVSVMACLIWWDRLPLIRYSRGVYEEEYPNSPYNATNTPPPYTFQSDEYSNDDDASEYEEADQNYKEGERIRGKVYDKVPKKTKPQVATTIDNSSLTTESDSVAKNFGWEQDQKRPKSVWLMSYPNSGTSYTMTMVARSSGRAIASNYGREVTDPGKTSTPLYPGQWGGPFYNPQPKRPLPREYILVKTHCGGRCVTCGPDKYVLNITEYLRECTRGSGTIPIAHGRSLGEDSWDNDDATTATSTDVSSSHSVPSGDVFRTVHYDISLVHKSIHIYRNIFHNIVSRFHLERNHWVRKRKAYEVNRYTNDPVGFQRWCHDLNKRYGPTPETRQTALPADIVELMQGVPCHGEVYRYVQWHNLANQVNKEHMKATLVIHYENYEKKWEDTNSRILDFLHLEFEGVKKEFHARHDYDPYFSDQQRAAIKVLVQRIATEPVWAQLKRYFPTEE